MIPRPNCLQGNSTDGESHQQGSRFRMHLHHSSNAQPCRILQNPAWSALLIRQQVSNFFQQQLLRCPTTSSAQDPSLLQSSGHSMRRAKSATKSKPCQLVGTSWKEWGRRTQPTKVLRDHRASALPPLQSSNVCF